MSYEKKEKVLVSVTWQTWVEVETNYPEDEKEVFELARVKWASQDFVEDLDLEFDYV